MTFFTAIIQMKRYAWILHVPLWTKQWKNQSQLDTGALESDTSEKELRQKIATKPANPLQELLATDFKVQIVSETKVFVKNRPYYMLLWQKSYSVKLPWFCQQW